MNNTSQKDLNYAGFWTRYIARIIDALILTGLLWLIIYFLSLGLFDVGDILSSLLLLFSISFLWGILTWTYYTVLTVKLGGTIGKCIVGLEVHSINGKRIEFKQSLFRHTVGYWLSSLIMGLGYYWVIRDKKCQGWHDQVSGTIVVKTSYNSARVFVALVSIIVLLLLQSSIWYGVFNNLYTNLDLRENVKSDIEFIVDELRKIESETKSRNRVTDFNDIQGTFYPDKDFENQEMDMLGVIIDTETYFVGSSVSIGDSCPGVLKGKVLDITNKNGIIFDIETYSIGKVEVSGETELVGYQRAVICDGKTYNGYELDLSVVPSKVHPKRGLYQLDVSPVYNVIPNLTKE